jgi:hypothetical protein
MILFKKKTSKQHLDITFYIQKGDIVVDRGGARLEASSLPIIELQMDIVNYNNLRLLFISFMCQ